MNEPNESEAPELRRFRMMLLIRAFEAAVVLEYVRHRTPMGGFMHLCDGQEAIAVGASEVFRHGTDTYAGTFRGHGWSIALGMSSRAAMAELYGKATGCCRGRGGSMHFRDAATGNLGGWATVGAQMPVGAGAAFAARYRGTGGVAFIILGDGALAQGVSAETLNLAGLLRLPAVFIVEDNGIALGTRVPRHSADPDLVRRGESFGMPARRLDGNDVEEVARVVKDAADRARRGDGPTYLVARTDRLRGFSMSDAMKYRSKDERIAIARHDPLTTYARQLTERGLLDQPAEERLFAEAGAIVADAVAFAEASPYPSLAARFDHLVAEGWPR